MYPNLNYTDHRDAAYFKEESRSSSPSGGITRTTNRGTSPTNDQLAAEKERAALLKRLSTASHLLKIKLDPTKGSQTPPQQSFEQRLSEATDATDHEADARHELGGSDGGGENLIENQRDAVLLRECSEEDAFTIHHSELFEGLAPFSSSERSFSLQRGERILFSTVSCRLVQPLQTTTGRMDISNVHLFFYPSSGEDESHDFTSSNRSRNNSEDSTWGSVATTQPTQPMSNKRWSLSNISSFHLRRHLLCNNALEFFFKHPTSDDNSTAFVVFDGTIERAAVLSQLLKIPMLKSIASKVNRSIKHVTELWVQRKMSNFDYLMHLNTQAGRSYNDLSQYPVFPWVLSDYTSEKLQFQRTLAKESEQLTRGPTKDTGDENAIKMIKEGKKDPASASASASSTALPSPWDPLSVFRDLSKPMGAINVARMAQFVTRYESFDEELAGVPKFHYGSHYSSAGVVLHYLLRMEPFTTWSVDLQGGRFDCPDRLFFSIREAWHSCTHSMSDVKELIPEFYYNYHFLTNYNECNFGVRQPSTKGGIGNAVGDVELPPWANGNPYEFVRIMRNALESDYVSSMLHNWIDLIFGSKQRGVEAEKATNLFFYLTYEGAVDLDLLNNDPLRRAATEEQINHFGQTPSQLFVSSHPTRKTKTDDDTFVLCPTIDAGVNHGLENVVFQTTLVPAEFHSKSKKSNASVPMHPGMKEQVRDIGVLSITCLSSTSSVSAHSKIVVVYDNGTVAIHGHKCTLPKSKHASKSTKKEHRLNWATPKTIPMNSSSSIQWTMARALQRNRVGSTHSSAVLQQQQQQEQFQWWMKPREELFASPQTGPHAGKVLFYGGHWDNQLKYCWIDVGTTKPLNGPYNMPGDASFRDVVTCLSFAEDGLTLGVGSNDSTCLVWAMNAVDRRIKLVHVLAGHDGAITGIRLSIKLDVVVSSSMDGLIAIHTLTNGHLLRSIPHPTGLAWHNVWMMGIDKGEIVGLSKKGLHLFSVHGDSLMECITHQDGVTCAAVSNNGETLITGGKNGVLTFRSLASSLNCVRQVDFESSSTVKTVHLSQHYVLVGFEDGSMGFVTELVKEEW